MQIMYSVRTRELFLAGNFPNFFSDKKCVAKNCLGEDSQDSQIHIYHCKKLQPKLMTKNNDSQYSHIFTNNVNKQIIATNILMQAYEKRSQTLSSLAPEKEEPV